MARRFMCALCLSLQLLQVVSQGDLSLSDALDGDDGKPTTTTVKPRAVPGGTGGDLSLEDFFNVGGPVTTTTTKTPKVGPKVPTKTNDPAKAKPAADDLDLADALDPKKDIGFGDKNKGQSGVFSDSDLADVSKDETYKPDKGKGGRVNGDGDQIRNREDGNSETTAEVGTIAGIVSAVAMALVGAVSSYISYQKKKLCFSIQQSLNTDMTKAENPEVAAEPQAQQTLLEPPSAEPPTQVKVVP